VTESTKTCRDCCQDKLITEFYANPTMADGRSNTCRKCTSSAKNAGYRLKRARERYDATGECGACCGLTWRRKKPRCAVCQKPFVKEDTAAVLEDIVQRRRFAS
jgi:hypothetical protein